MKTYTLKYRKPVACFHNSKWSKWMWGRNRMDRRRVRWTKINSSISVSTVFLGLDHSYGSDNTPDLFETMIFNSDDDFDDFVFGRCGTWRQALKIHWTAVESRKLIIYRKFN